MNVNTSPPNPLPALKHAVLSWHFPVSFQRWNFLGPHESALARSVSWMQTWHANAEDFYWHCRPHRVRTLSLLRLWDFWDEIGWDVRLGKYHLSIFKIRLEEYMHQHRHTYTYINWCNACDHINSWPILVKLKSQTRCKVRLFWSIRMQASNKSPANATTHRQRNDKQTKPSCHLVRWQFR